MIIVIQIYATSLRIYKYLFCRIPLGGRSLPLVIPSSGPFTAGRRRRLSISSRRTKPYPVPHTSLCSGLRPSLLYQPRARSLGWTNRQAALTKPDCRRWGGRKRPHGVEMGLGPLHESCLACPLTISFGPPMPCLVCQSART